jgi:hypothetical protein
VGTEWGLYVSLDGGRSFSQFTAGLPNVAVRDLVIHPRDHDLVVATHGRGLYVVDDLTPLRKLTARELESDVAFLESRPSAMLQPLFEFGFGGDDDYLGRSPSESASITYYLKKRHMFGDLRLEVYDPQGQLISSLPGGKRRGINRVEWPMRRPAPRTAPGAEIVPSFFALFGPRVPEGTYTVKMIKGPQTYASQVTLVPDPRSRHTAADREVQRRTANELYRLVEELAFLVGSVENARDQARARARELPEKDALRKKLEAFGEAMEKQRIGLVSTSRGEGISGEEKLREELAMLYGSVNGYEGKPTRSQLDRMEVLAQDLEAAMARFNAAADKEMPALNAGLGRAGKQPIAKLTAEEWAKK